ncbi:Major facilitator superfamily domain containing protein [Cryptosporidium felis]|nr:Major facilitator superfamily domain containing protein [Cryptosporidium felis]
MGNSKYSGEIQETEPLMNEKKSSNINAYILVFLAFSQMLVSSGIILGWQSLANVIKDTGSYRFLCDDPSVPCIEEEVYLANLMSTSQSIQMFSVLFLSILMDLIGPKFMAVCQLITALGTFMIAVGDPRGTIDYIWYGAILQNLCGCVYIPSFIHLSNLFPKGRAVIASTFSTLYGCSSLTFLVVQIVNSHYKSTLESSLLPLAIVQAFFVLFSLLLPNKIIHLGDECKFSLKKYGFYSESGSVECDSGGNYRLGNQITEVQSRSSGFFESKIKPLLNCIFSKMFVVQFMFEVLVVVSVNFYVSTLSLQIEELSNLSSIEERKKIGYYWSTIFTTISPFGSIVGVLEGYLVDKYGLWKSALVPTILLTACAAFKLVPIVPFQLLTFIAYTTSQEAVFSSAYSLFTLVIPTEVICTFAGVNLLLQSFPVGYLPQYLISLFSQEGWAFQEINFILIPPTIIVGVIYVKYLYTLERKSRALQDTSESSV